MPTQGLAALKKQRAIVRERIVAKLDSFLIGTVARSPAMKRYALTTKAEGKTKTLYVRMDIEKQALEMAACYRKLWADIVKLSSLNWEILKKENE